MLLALFTLIFFIFAEIYFSLQVARLEAELGKLGKPETIPDALIYESLMWNRFIYAWGRILSSSATCMMVSACFSLMMGSENIVNGMILAFSILMIIGMIRFLKV